MAIAFKDSNLNMYSCEVPKRTHDSMLPEKNENCITANFSSTTQSKENNWYKIVSKRNFGIP